MSAPPPDLTLEIHHLDVHGGDSTAIIVRQRKSKKIIYKVLIDAGAEKHGSAYLRTFLNEQACFQGKSFVGEDVKGNEFDLIIATHYHADHIQGFSYAEIKFKSYMDNGWNAEGAGGFSPKNFTGDAGSTVFTRYKAQIENQTPRPTRIPIPFIEKHFDLRNAKPLEILLEKPGAATGITLTCYCANGIIANGEDVLKMPRPQGTKPSPNDSSLAFILKWDDFTYFTAGDLSGDKNKTKYQDIEGPLVDYLSGQGGPFENNKSVTVFKASHHGSQLSNQEKLFEKLDPECVIISCNQDKGVPSDIFLERLNTHVEAQAEGKPPKSKIVLLVNTLKAFAQGDPRYAKLDALRKSKGQSPQNSGIPEANIRCGADTQSEPESISNLGIKSILIRRHSGGAKDVNEQLAVGAVKIERDKYDIIMSPRSDDENKNLQEVTKLKTYDMNNPIAAIARTRRGAIGSDLKTELDKGFKKQAKLLARLLTGNQPDYVQRNFPALVSADPAPGEDALVDKMWNLFNRNYQLNKKTGAYEWLGGNALHTKEKMTLYNLLICNKYQQQFMRLFNNPVQYRWTTSKAWNAVDPPLPQASASDPMQIDPPLPQAPTTPPQPASDPMQIDDRSAGSNRKHILKDPDREENARKRQKLEPATDDPAPAPDDTMSDA